MHPYFRAKRWYWIFQLLGWAAFWLTQVQAGVMLNRYTPRTLLWLTIEAGMGLLFTHTYRALLLRSGVLRASLAWQAGAAVLGLAGLSVSLHTLGLLGYSLMLGKGAWPFHSGAAMYAFGVVGAARYLVVWVLGYHFFVVGEWLAQAQVGELRAEAARRQVELDLLRSQINPHFLFNALNSVMALTSSDPKRARTALTQLSDLLRYTLQYEQRQLIPFREELAAVRDYLALEQTRFGAERLRFSLAVPEPTLEWVIPPATLLTLVENAVKHGFSTRPEEGGLHLQASITPDTDALRLVISHPGHLAAPSPEQGKPASGMGLANTRLRLRALYGDAAVLNLKEAPHGTVTTTLQLPRATLLMPSATAHESHAAPAYAGC